MNNLKRLSLKKDIYGLREFLKANIFNLPNVKHNFRLGCMFYVQNYDGEIDENELKRIIDRWYLDKNLLILKIMEIVK